MVNKVWFTEMWKDNLKTEPRMKSIDLPSKERVFLILTDSRKKVWHAGYTGDDTWRKKFSEQEATTWDAAQKEALRLFLEYLKEKETALKQTLNVVNGFLEE